MPHWSLPLTALALILTFSAPASAQVPQEAAGAVRGRIVDSVTGRAVPTATVRLMRSDNVHSTVESDRAGYFSFDRVPEGVYSVEVEEAGYLKAEQADVRVVLNRVAAVEFALVGGSEKVLDTVVVTARAPAGDPRAAPNTVRLEREEIRRNPGSAGDVFRALDVLPGVVSTGEFSNFTVRGNGPRDNLILIDGIPFDKVTHFDESLGEEEINGGGRYSIFAPNIVGSAKFSPGGWRAAEGGRNGSLLELEIAEGNPMSSTVGARLDVIGVEADYDGPSYVADNTSLLFSARKFDFSNLFEMIDEKDIGTPRMTDVIAKSVTELNAEHSLELLAVYAGEDFKRTVDNALESDDFEDMDIGESDQDSSLLGVTWRWYLDGGAQWRNTAYYRDSDKSSSEGEAYPDLAEGPEPTPETTPFREDILRIDEAEKEIGWRSDFSTRLGPDGILSLGTHLARVDLDFDRRLSGDWIRYVYETSDFRADPEQRYIVLTPEEYDSELSETETRVAAYADYAWTLGDFTWTPGIRYEYDGFSRDSAVAPRMQLVWQADALTRVWTGGGVYYQSPRYLEIAADPSNRDLKRERSTQVTLGVSRFLHEDLRFSAEAYYQELDDLIVIDDRTTNVARNIGDGHAKGVDLMLVKRMSRSWTASAAYSWSRARRDENLGEGSYPADWDRPHAFGIVGAWQPTDRWTFSAKWKWASGRPTDDFVIHSDVLAGEGPVRYSKELTRTNADRLPAYHALSLRADYQRRFGPVSLVAYLDVLNVYGRKNGNAYEWDERRGVNIIEGLDEALPTIGLRFEYSWTPG